MAQKFSFPKERMRILLLEGVHPAAVAHFQEAGYKPELVKGAMSEADLIKEMPNLHALGIRSKTEVTEAVLKAAKNLLTIGCFCIGTNQVDLRTSRSRGIPVFNAPFSNTRSVAELAMAQIVMLARQAAHKSMLLHNGAWDKSAIGCMEVRHKSIGIIGYGHIGPQIGLLAEAFGMKVFFYDIVNKLPLGNATKVNSLKELFALSDFVTLHVPETPQTKNLIGAKELRMMKRGSFLLNLSRGTVVDIDALAAALKSKQLAGAAIDVFPYEPSSNDEPFHSVLCGLPNVILTPHIGGSTEEAQRNIGIEVAQSMVSFIDQGSTFGSVNFPGIDLPVLVDRHRILNIHRNVPGVLSKINKIIADLGVNISAQYLNTLEDIGYLIMDVDTAVSLKVKQKIETLKTNIKTRVLF